MSLMERFANPELFQTLSFGDKTAASLITTLMGMGTTFVVLILIWFMLYLMGKILQALDSKNGVAASAPAAGGTVAAAPAKAVSASDDEQIAAVVTAGMLAYLKKRE